MRWQEKELLGTRAAQELQVDMHEAELGRWHRKLGAREEALDTRQAGLDARDLDLNRERIKVDAQVAVLASCYMAGGRSEALGTRREASDPRP